MTKTSLAQKLNTSLPQLGRILDPENTLITLDVLEQIAHAVGKQLHIKFA